MCLLMDPERVKIRTTAEFHFKTFFIQQSLLIAKWKTFDLQTIKAFIPVPKFSKTSPI